LQIGYFRINPIHVAADKIIAVTNAADATVNFDLISKLNQKNIVGYNYFIGITKVHGQIYTNEQLMLLYALQIGMRLICAYYLLTFYRFTFFKNFNNGK
jgi:hypothetical protein